MRFITPRRIVIAGILAVAVCGVPLFNSLPPGIAASDASLLALVLSRVEISSPMAGEATIDPTAMMANLQLDLPVEQYDIF